MQTGLVRRGFIHFAFLGQESFWAAEASECAGEQGEEFFWLYHDYLFANQNGENRGAFEIENLKSFAGALGLDTEAFNACLDSGRYTSLVQEQAAFSSSIGVRSTPTFIINGTPVIGAQPFEVFEQLIESLTNR